MDESRTDAGKTNEMLTVRPNQFIAIAGNIGAGKSTLTRMLAGSFGWQPFFEANAENPYLEDFYADMQRWSFQSQIFFLSKRLEHHRQLVEYPGSVVQDRTVYEDAEIFARNLHQGGAMSARDWETYCRLYQAVSAFLPPPSLVIYLRAQVDTLLRHIAQRGRTFEQHIAPDYVARLNTLYDHWIEDWTACPALVLEMDALDFEHNPDQYQQIVARVAAALGHPLASLELRR
jgi:deoxyadenosine/deoxycytidine kinase